MLSMLFAGFIILFVSMREFGNDDAFAASTFIISIIATMFFALEFISTQMLTIIIILAGISFIIIVMRRQQ